MIDPSQHIRIEVRFGSSEELDHVQKVLFYNGAKDVEVFDGTVAATVEAQTLPSLKKDGLLIDFTHEFELNPEENDELSPKLQSLDSQSKVPNDKFEILLKTFRQQTKFIDIDLNTFRGTVRSTPRENDIPVLDGLEAIDPHSAIDTRNESILDEDAYIVKLKGPMREKWRGELDEVGITLTAYFESDSLYTYTTFITHEQLKKLEAFAYVSSIKRYGLTQTINSDLQEFLSDQSQLETTKTFQVVLHQQDHLERVKTFIDSSGDAKSIDLGENAIRFQAQSNSTLIPALANMPYVASIDLYDAPRLFCDIARTMIGLDISPTFEYTGKSQIAAIFDSGVDDGHPDLQKRIKSATSYGDGTVSDLSGHGTHVAGIICGDGEASNGKIKGIAPDCKLVSIGIVDQNFRLDLPVDLGKLMQVAVNEGVNIINLSWGYPMKGDYHYGSYSLDKFAYDNPEVIIIVAAGNEGHAKHGIHSYKTVGVPATAKNVLTVGAAASRRPINPVETWGKRKPNNFPKVPQKDETLVLIQSDHMGPAAGSSRGPTDYDSIKPEVVAPGTYILATKATGVQEAAKEKYHQNSNYTFKTGTSMAAPIVSGLAALIREYLQKDHNYFSPSSSLVKAIIIASTQPITNIRNMQNDQSLKQVGFPDFDQGFGLVNFESLLSKKTLSLLFIDDKNSSDRALVSRAPYGGARKSSRQFDFELKSGSDLHIVLCWLDPPAKGVQNNLQLSLGTPNSKWILGNMGHIYKKSEFFDASPGSMNVYPHDKYNTVEKISISNAPGGKYRLRVTAQNTISVPQGYSIAILGQFISELREIIY